MKANIVLFSTRYIGWKGTILENATRSANPSKALEDYFYAQNETELNAIVANERTKSSQAKLTESSTTANTDARTGGNATEQLQTLSVEIIKNLPDSEERKKLKTLYLKLKEHPSNEIREALMEALEVFLDTEARKKQMQDIKASLDKERNVSTSFNKDKDFDKPAYLEHEAFNTDNSSPDGKPLKLRDRISLFYDKDTKVVVDNELYQFYAVLTLKKADNLDDEARGFLSPWVNSLTNAIKEELGQGFEEINLIFMLHDKDLSGMGNKSFHIIYSTNEIEHNPIIKRSLCVFSHPDLIFSKIIHNTTYNARQLFNEVNDIIDKSLKLQHLKRASELLSGLTHANIHERIEEFNKLTSKNYSEELLEAEFDNEIDNIKKEIRTISDSLNSR